MADARPAALLTTARTVVRPWRLEEAPRLLAIRRLPEVAQWLADPTPWTDLATAEATIASWAAEQAARPHLGTFAIVPTATGVPAGSVTLKPLPGADDEFEIGWYLHPDAHGQGLAREAARAMLEHAWRHGVPRVWAVMWPHNGPSAAVARAIGMTDLGVRRDPWYGTPEDPDSRMFRADAPGGGGEG